MPRFRKMFAPPLSMAPGPLALGPDRLRDLTDFGANPGALRARSYLPEALPAQAALVAVLHGCTQTAAGYDHGAGWSALADEAGFALLFPEQQPANNPNRCFNWFSAEDVGRGRGEAESIRQMVDRMLATHGLDRNRVFVTGLSAGGAMTMAMLASYPDVFAGGAVIAGLPFGTATSVPQAFQRMRGEDAREGDALAALVRAGSGHAGPWPTLSVWQGDADRTVSPRNAALIVSQWRALHGLPAEPTRTERRNGHARRVWSDADGRDLIEEVTIAGMGHGTPLDTAGEAAGGNAGPFMLEAGISSTRDIARFWGLLPPRAAASAARGSAAEPARALVPAAPPAASAPRLHRAPEPAAADTPAGAGFVQATIENALRAAGLMR